MSARADAKRRAQAKFGEGTQALNVDIPAPLYERLRTRMFVEKQTFRAYLVRLLERDMRGWSPPWEQAGKPPTDQPAEGPTSLGTEAATALPAEAPTPFGIRRPTSQRG